MRAFVDTSGFYALADRSDQHHGRAKSAFADRSRPDQWITTDHVVVETWLLLRARLGFSHACRFWDAVAAGLAVVAGVSSEDLISARGICEAWRDQEFSLVDCTSFAFMERVGLTSALAFDDHFRLYRFGLDKRRAFHLVGDRSESP